MKFNVSAACLLLLGLLLVAFAPQSADARQLPIMPVVPANFDTPMDNPYQPIVAGMTYVYEVEDEDGLVINEITYTDCTIEILGVECAVIYDVEYLMLEDGTLLKLEETFDFHAWDNWGNFWYFGEDTIEYEYDDDWNLVGCNTEGTWRAGVDGALAGIILLGDPKPGQSTYQEFYEGEAEDQGKVLRTNAKVSTDFGKFKNVLVLKEWTNLSPGAVEQKLFAPGVGLVLIYELTGGPTVKVPLVDIHAQDFDCNDVADDFYLIFDAYDD